MKKTITILLLVMASAFLFGHSIADFYYTYDSMVDSLFSWEERYPDLFKVVEIGTSQLDDLPIYACKLTNNAQEDEDKPAVLVIGSLHAEEIIGPEIAMRHIKSILDRPNMQPHRNWLANIEMWFVPNLNPEGWKVVTDGLDITYRKNKRDNNNNGVFDYVPGMGQDIDGVDINRNWAFNWVHGDSLYEVKPGTSEPYDYYRGPGPMSEKETLAAANLFEMKHFVLSICWHSSRSGKFCEKTYIPFNWFEVVASPDLEIARTIGREFSSRVIKLGGSNGYEPLDSLGRTGGFEDEVYRRWGTIQLRVETGPPGFGNLQPTDFNKLMSVVNECTKGQSYLFNRAMRFSELERSPMLTGHVTDAVTGEPLQAEVIVEERHADYFAPRKSDEKFGRYWRPLLAGAYTVTFRKEGYQTATYENVVVSNTGWSIKDAQLQPRERTQFTGTVLLNESPVDATIKLSMPGWKPDTLYTHTIDVTNGYFNYETWTGERDIIVLAEDAYPYIGTINIRPGNHIVQIDLSEREVLFNEDWENSTDAWEIDGPWQVIRPAELNGKRAIIDSYDGGRNLYSANADVSITTKNPIDLLDFRNDLAPILSFNHNLHTVWDYDHVYVDVSVDGEEWDNVYKRSGQHDYWHTTYVALEPVAGEEKVFLRFRLKAETPAGTGGKLVDPGWMINEITVFSGSVQFTSAEHDTIENIKPIVSLNQNYPNPFNPETTISFTIFNKEVSDAQIAIYNIKGALVEKISINKSDISKGSIVWNAGGKASGVYLYQLILDGKPYELKKAVLMK